MKPKVEITLVHEEGLLDDVTLGFTTLEQIDSFIETFEEMRADLEHQIEMEKQRKRDKRKRAKMRRKENKKEVMQLPIKLKNGNEFIVTCDDVIFNEGNLSLDYVLNGELLMTIPLSSLDSEPDFEE